MLLIIPSVPGDGWGALRVKQDLQCPITGCSWFLLSVTKKEEDQQVGKGFFWCTSTGHWHQGDHTDPHLGATSSLIPPLPPLIPSSTSHLFAFFAAVHARCLQPLLPTRRAVAQHRNASMKLTLWKTAMLITCQLIAFTLLAFRMLICSSYTVSLFFSRNPSLWYST